MLPPHPWIPQVAESLHFHGSSLTLASPAPSVAPSPALLPALLSSPHSTFLRVTSVTEASRLHPRQARSQGNAPDPPIPRPRMEEPILIPPPSTTIPTQQLGKPRGAQHLCVPEHHHQGHGKVRVLSILLGKTIMATSQFGILFFFSSFF